MLLSLSVILCSVIAFIRYLNPSPSRYRRWCQYYLGWTLLTGMLIPFFYAFHLSWTIAGAVAALFVVYGRARAYGPPVMRHITVEHTKIMESIRVVQWSDLHADVSRKLPDLEDTLLQLAALRPDLIVMTGDMIDGILHAEWLTWLQHIRQRYPIISIHGNHEVQWGADQWQAQYEQVNVPVLRNTSYTMKEVCFHGVDYTVIQSVEHDDDHMHVHLIHSPHVRLRGGDLQLSGHTHGGQMFPLTLWGARFPCGWLPAFDGRPPVYVSAGWGVGGPAIRLGRPPEWTVIDIKPIASNNEHSKKKKIRILERCGIT